jgi:hypothetical protein
MRRQHPAQTRRTTKVGTYNLGPRVVGSGRFQLCFVRRAASSSRARLLCLWMDLLEQLD